MPQPLTGTACKPSETESESQSCSLGAGAVAGLLTHSLGSLLRVGRHEIILNHLDACNSCGLLPGFPVILFKGAFSGHHCILPCDNLYRSARQASEMDLLAGFIRNLEVQVTFAVSEDSTSLLIQPGVAGWHFVIFSSPRAPLFPGCFS